MIMTEWYENLHGDELNGIYAKVLNKDGTAIYGQFDDKGYLHTENRSVKVLNNYSDNFWCLDTDGFIKELVKLLDPKGWDWVEFCSLNGDSLDNYDYAVAINKRIYNVLSYSNYLSSFTISVNGEYQRIPQGIVSGCYRRQVFNGLFQDSVNSIWSCKNSECRLLAGNRKKLDKYDLHSEMSFKEVNKIIGPLHNLSKKVEDYDYFPSDN